MRTPEQLKGKIRNVAKAKEVSSQEILQMFLFERVIDRLSRTRYAAKAVTFANRVDRQNCVSFVDGKGSTYKFNKKSNEFAIITKKGFVVTYFKPKDGYKYYLSQKKGKAKK